MKYLLIILLFSCSLPKGYRVAERSGMLAMGNSDTMFAVKELKPEKNRRYEFRTWAQCFAAGHTYLWGDTLVINNKQYIFLFTGK